MKRTTFVSTIFLLAATPMAGAQPDSAPVYGAVYRYAPGDEDPPPLPSVTVTLHAAYDTSRNASSLTDNHGRYAFYNVSPGAYDLFFYINFNPDQEEAVQHPNLRMRITIRANGATNVRPVVLTAD